MKGGFGSRSHLKTRADFPEGVSDPGPGQAANLRMRMRIPGEAAAVWSGAVRTAGPGTPRHATPHLINGPNF